MAGSLWRRGLSAFFWLLVACVHSSSAWSGNVCQETKCDYVTRRVCSYRTWLGCCAYKTVRVPRTRVIRFCCSGWRHDGDRRCDIPVCNPPCLNRGKCTQPGKCSCPREYSGPRCGKSQCSHLDPCYPGECAPGSTRCSCSQGYYNSGQGREEQCLKLIEKPELFQIQATMSYWANMKGSYMEMYSLLADSSGQEDADFIWTNRKKFNRLIFNATSQFPVPRLPPKPEYVSDSGFGIVSADVRILHTKEQLPSRRRRSKRNVDRYISKNDTLRCDGKISDTRPATSVFVCNLSPRFDRSLETGDILSITFSAKSGGFRKLKNLNTGSVFNTQSFLGGEIKSSVEFRFDLEAPFHCSETKTCARGEKAPLSVQDLTKGPLEISWSGWQDVLSKMYRYTVEVFPLNRTLDDKLRILRPLNPIYSRSVFHASMSLPIRYTPPGPGMYAVILEAADLANNTRFVRRLTLYDPDSDVTTDPAHRLFFPSASSAANFTYQNNTSSRIELSWKGAFRNKVYETLGALGEVEPYPRQLEDGLKHIPFELDDHDGSRTVDAIPNRRGIVNFDLAYQKDSRRGSGEAPPSNPPLSVNWQKMGLNESYTIPESVDDGDTVIAWVRASDVIGHRLVRRTEVTFDQTEAEVGKLEFLMNQPVPGIPFSSTFRLDAIDPQSGIAQIKWIFTRSNGTVIHSDTQQGRLTQACAAGEFRRCYCTPRGQCYLLDQSYSLSNCHMMVEKESLATEIIHVQVDVTNSAGLVTKRRMEKGQLTMLNGTEAYFPPQNVRVLSLSESGATITWDFPPSCYERTDLWVVVPDSSGKEVMRPVHKNAEKYDVVGLQPGKDYSVQLIARYSGQVKSDPAHFSFRTAEEAGLTGGETAGVVIGLLLLLVLLVLLVLAIVIRRRGAPAFLQSERFENLRNSMRIRGSKRGLTEDIDATARFSSKENEYVASPEQPEDLYLAAGQTWQERRSWQVPTASLVLQDQIASGKFADVYRATWSGGKSSTVAAKILKQGFSSSDADKLMKKIEFFATEVGTHDNVLLFHGAVLDNEHLGPVMIMEYCEMGQLDKWLVQNRSNVNEGTTEKLFRFSKDIACGMEYLASKRIVHSRLAARNVLLNFLLDAKVAGFGPRDVTEGKVPAKWASPEVLLEKPPTEKSDVWSFGVTLWEVFSMGETPYPDVRGTEMGPHLKSGKRMAKPEYADDTFYTLMQNCWKERPSGRPSFADIKQQLCALFGAGPRNSGDFYYDANQLRK